MLTLTDENGNGIEDQQDEKRGANANANANVNPNVNAQLCEHVEEEQRIGKSGDVGACCLTVCLVSTSALFSTSSLTSSRT